MNILGEQFRQGCSLPLDVPIHLMLWVDDAQLAHREAEAAGWPDLGRQIGEALDGWGTWVSAEAVPPTLCQCHATGSFHLLSRIALDAMRLQMQPCALQLCGGIA